jgi:hypothetical protein
MKREMRREKERERAEIDFLRVVAGQRFMFLNIKKILEKKLCQVLENCHTIVHKFTQ